MLRRFFSAFLLIVILAAVAVGAVEAAIPAAAATRSDVLPDRGLVVRIYYSDPAELVALRRTIDVWAVYPGYVDAQVWSDEYLTLLAQGYRIEIDQARTAQLKQPAQRLPGQINGIPGYACYRTVEETFTTAQGIVSTHPNLAQWIDIGDSWEKLTAGGDPGYDLMVLKLTNQAVPGPKPKLFVMSSMHAREYAPAELNTRFAEYLIGRYDVDPDITWLLDTNEVHLQLQANPDGRKKAETGLSWRKNTNNNYCANSNSRGADLNRNYPFYWNSCAPGDGCSSGVACELDYRGPSAASEPETQAVINYVRSQYPDLRADDLGAAAPITTSGIFLDLHSYSELILWPWGFTSTVSLNGTAMQTLGRKFAYFNDYTPQQSVGLYPTDGTTDDFAYGELGVPAYTFEVGTNFFQDCTTFENTIVPDNLPAMVYALKAARRPYQTPAGPDTLSATLTPTSTIAGTLVTLNASANDTRYRAGYGEPTQNIAAARYTIDAPSWSTGVISYPLSAADGTFNSSVEAITAQLNTAGLAPGRHSVFIEAQDASGSWGAPTAVFVWVSAAPDSALAGVVQTQGSAAPIEGAIIRASLSPTLTFETLSQADGSYQLGVVAGIYSLNASKYGYLPATINTVTASLGLTTTQNITLTPAGLHSVSGIVRDQLTNHPLAANLTIAGYPGATISTDPITGFYSVTLAAGITYTFQVNASGSGYGSISRSVGPLTANRTEDFMLNPDLNSCTAAGYAWGGVKQAFDASTLPLGWTVINNVGTHGWSFNDPGGRGNLTGGAGNFAIADSDAAGSSVSMNTELRTPSFDLSTQPHVTLTFKTDFDYYSAEVADVDVSTNGAAGPWTNVWRKTADYRGPKTESVNLSALAGGQANVMLRFHYYNATYEYWWEVDDVRLGQCLVMPYTINLPIITSTSSAQAGYPGSIVTYTLQVSNTDTVAHTFDVSSLPNGWPTSIFPPIGPVAAHTAQPFTVTVTIPTHTLASTADVVQLTVAAHDDPALMATTSLTTTAGFVPGLELAPAHLARTGQAGDWVTYTLNLTNTGNATDTIALDYSGEEWAVQGPMSVTLAAWAGSSLDVTVHVPPTATPGLSDTVHLTAAGAGVFAFSELTTTASRPYAVFLPLVRK